jgi:hypothetical protein
LRKQLRAVLAGAQTSANDRVIASPLAVDCGLASREEDRWVPPIHGAGDLGDEQRKSVVTTCVCGLVR